ncbi:Leukocyte receptor cluster member 1 [Manis javanica]|nr:Leukocyte receptor cluster member 1 [Manis javanica]
MTWDGRTEQRGASASGFQEQKTEQLSTTIRQTSQGSGRSLCRRKVFKSCLTCVFLHANDPNRKSRRLLEISQPTQKLPGSRDNVCQRMFALHRPSGRCRTYFLLHFQRVPTVTWPSTARNPGLGLDGSLLIPNPLREMMISGRDRSGGDRGYTSHPAHQGERSGRPSAPPTFLLWGGSMTDHLPGGIESTRLAVLG